MIQYSPHLSLGSSKDMFNILNGLFGDFHEFDAVLDCSPTKFSKKWHKDKSIVLKNVYVKGEMTRNNIRSIIDFISSMHKDHKNVLISSTSNQDTFRALFCYLVIKKEKSVIEAINSIESISGDQYLPYLSESFTNMIVSMV
jgi:hypothetical protein